MPQIGPLGQLQRQRFVPQGDSIIMDECRHLTDAAIIWLATGCPGLNNVNMKYCTKLANVSTITLATLNLLI